MINVERASEILRSQYPDLEPISNRVFRGLDVHEGRPYAVRYFDLRDEVHAAADHLQEYQDALLGADYYSAEARSDLRWNHYLYFVVSSDRFAEREFLRAKATIEADREYARKMVVAEPDLGSVIARAAFGAGTGGPLPPDALSIWASILDKHSLGYIVDESLQVPAVVKHITDGSPQGLRRAPSASPLDDEEAAASQEFLGKLEIQGFRRYPDQKTFDFGVVNLVSGVNGVGKTSLLEAIEFLFCRKTRRTDKPVLPQTTIKGTWAKSGLTLETRDVTSSARLRARHLAWYGKTELRTLTLDDSFGKFNFLDTDAAVRLTVEGSRERLTKDLFQLLLGAESSKALDRLVRVASQLDESRRGVEKNVGVLDLRRSDAVRRVEEIRATPHESDELFSELLSALRTVGWRHSPADKSDTTRLGEALQAAVRNLRLLKGAGPPLATTRARLEAITANLQRVLETLAEESREEAIRQRKERAARGQVQALSRRVTAIEAVTPLVAAGVRALSRDRNALKQRHAELAARVARVEQSINGVPAELHQSRSSVRDAVRRWEEIVTDAAKAEQEARVALTAVENVQAAVTNAQQQLRSAALGLMEHTHNTTHCPVCHSEFTEAELMARLEALSAGGVVMAETDHVRANVQAAESVRARRSKELEALRVLQGGVGEGEGLSVAAALSRHDKDRAEVASLRSDLASADQAVQEHERIGWSVSRLEELSAAAGVSDMSVSVEALDQMRQLAVEERDALMTTVTQLEKEAQERDARIAEVASTHSLAVALSLAEIEIEVTGRMRTYESAVRAATGLERQLDLGASEEAEELEVQLIQVHEVVIRLRTALEQEREGDQALARETRRAEDSIAESAALRVQLKRIESAHRVISELVAEQSDQVLAEQVLRENAAAIASTFAKVHAPSEFDVAGDNGLRIVRRPTDKSVELEEMSSGQRAAYALSLFLAMNERLRSGPKVLIFDDPVAHADDINTLSFLDHLRDIALTGLRQIFFATADAKLSGLFLRKFRFLGEQFKHIQLTRE